MKLSNRKFLQENFKSIKSWTKSNDIQFRNFDQISEDLYIFLVSEFLSSKQIILQVINCLNDVIDECNEIDFDISFYTIAYIITHFLNRYHRFQKICTKLLENFIFPIRNRISLTTDILSVGCGPAPSLFAIADFFLLLRQYGKFRNIKRLEDLNFNTDYVEISQSFRQFLHHFIEFTNYKKEKPPEFLKFGFRPIPYHHGSFYNVFDIETEKLMRRSYNIMLFGRNNEHHIKHKYNMIIFSYFITSNRILNKLLKKNSIEDLCRSLRNGGLLIIVGAPEYKNIYAQVEDLLNSSKFWNFSMNKLISEPMQFDYFNKYGKKIKEFVQKIFNHLEKVIKGENVNFKDLLLYNITQNVEPAYSKWFLLVFQKKLYRSFN